MRVFFLPAQAKLFKDSGHTIVLVSEKTVGKNYDAIMDKGQSLELKTITGSLSSVEKRFGEALNQGDNVFLRISQDFSAHEVYIKLRNVLLSHPRADGDVYVYLEKQKKMYRWKMRNIT